MGTRVKKVKNNRLAKNFHRTFIPEKQYLGAILKYAAESGPYDMQAIADATGIPTGKSSGKAIPTADYAIGWCFRGHWHGVLACLRGGSCMPGK